MKKAEREAERDRHAWDEARLLAGAYSPEADEAAIHIGEALRELEAARVALIGWRSRLEARGGKMKLAPNPIAAVDRMLEIARVALAYMAAPKQKRRQGRPDKHERDRAVVAFAHLLDGDSTKTAAEMTKHGHKMTPQAVARVLTRRDGVIKKELERRKSIKPDRE